MSQQQIVQSTGNLVPSNIELRMSGGLTNATQALSIGGAMSLSDFGVFSQTTPFLGNLFAFVSQADATSGKSYYRCVYIRNNNASRTARNCYIWFETLNRDTDITISMGLDPALINGTATTIADQYTAPSGVTFTQPDKRADALFIGDLKAGDYFAFWVLMVVAPGAAQYYKDNFVFRFTGEMALPSKNIADFGWAAVGDISCDRKFAKINIANIIARIKASIPLKSFIPLGNLSFVDDDRCFTQLTRDIDAIVNLVFGIKEIIDQDDDDDDDDHGKMPQIFQKWASHYNIKFPFYSYNLHNVHFLHMCTEIPYDTTSAQYKFVTGDLGAASVNSNVNWIVVCYHQPMYTAGGKPPQANFDAAQFRDIYHPMFDQYKVDLVLQGHCRNYQRTYPIMYDQPSPANPNITDTGTTTYQDPAGEIFLILGTGGFSLDKDDITNNKPPYFVITDNKDFGYGWFTVTNNGSTLTGTFYNSSNISIDQFQMNKTIL